MTMPPDDGTHTILVSILAKQTEISERVAVISEQLKDLPDHEARIRALERWRWSLPVSALAALASGAAAWVAYLHR